MTLGERKGGIEPEELLADMVGMLDAEEMVGTAVNELLEDTTGTPEVTVAVEDIADGPGVLVSPGGRELLVEIVGNPDGAEEVPL